MKEQANITLRNECYRKLLHLSSLWIPILIWNTGSEITLWVLIPLTLLALIIEFLRRHNPVIAKIYSHMWHKILREHETGTTAKPQFSGGVWMLLAATIATALFPPLIAITSLSVMMISDTVAALVGRRWGKYPFLDKSLEGSSAFFISALLITSIIGAMAEQPPLFFTLGAVAALIATTVEAISKRLHIDDNLSITLSFGFTILILEELLLSAPVP